MGYRDTSRWQISPYPDGRDWAFTIVHDADDAFSARLGPLFDEFDRCGIKVSVTAFAFWADWAGGGSVWDTWMREDPFRKPRAVPLEHPEEREFYKSLVARGHEVGLHTASDSHDPRERVERAFEFFRGEFGMYPPIYVEHRDNLENHQYRGADPASDYFITDLLNRYKPWVWIVSPSAIPYDGRGRYFDVLSSQRPLLGYGWARAWGTLKGLIKTRRWDRENGRLYELLRRGGSPFDEYARRKYGLARAFRRSGLYRQADGSGFLEWYQDRHLDALEQHGGLAIVYTHLNTNWLDIESRRMRPALAARLAAVASRNVWLATASAILERLWAMKRVFIADDGDWVKIVNASDRQVDGLTVVSPRGEGLGNDTRRLPATRHRKVVVGAVRPFETLVFRKLG